jgi:hypothetical protein
MGIQVRVTITSVTDITGDGDFIAYGSFETLRGDIYGVRKSLAPETGRRWKDVLDSPGVISFETEIDLQADGLIIRKVEAVRPI